MAERPRYSDFAHQKEPKNLAPANWATTPVGQFFKDGKQNRDSHSEMTGADASMSSMGRKVIVEHHHFKDKG